MSKRPNLLHTLVLHYKYFRSLKYDYWEQNFSIKVRGLAVDCCCFQSDEKKDQNIMQTKWCHAELGEIVT